MSAHAFHHGIHVSLRVVPSGSLPLLHKALPPSPQLSVVQFFQIDILLDIQIHSKQRLVGRQIAFRKRSRAQRQHQRLSRPRSFGSPAIFAPAPTVRGSVVSLATRGSGSGVLPAGVVVVVVTGAAASVSRRVFGFGHAATHICTYKQTILYRAALRERRVPRSDVDAEFCAKINVVSNAKLCYAAMPRRPVEKFKMARVTCLGDVLPHPVVFSLICGTSTYMRSIGIQRCLFGSFPIRILF